MPSYRKAALSNCKKDKNLRKFMRRYTVILNPKSGSGKNLQTIRALRECLLTQGHQVLVRQSRSLRHVELLTMEARSENVDGVIAMGGDGTINKVLECLAYSNIPLLVIPAGTENLLACEFGLDGSFGVTWEALHRGPVRTLDLVRANDRVFMAIAGFGFDAEVINRIMADRTGHITHSYYFWPICRTFMEYRFPSFRVEADGECVNDEPALVFVGNIARYAAGLPILPNADSADGLLDLTIFRCRNRAQLLSHSFYTLINRAHHGPDVERRRCRRLRISSCDTTNSVQLDGDPGPSLPLEIEVLPAAARLFTPPPQNGDPYAGPVRHYFLRRLLTR